MINLAAGILMKEAVGGRSGAAIERSYLMDQMPPIAAPEQKPLVARTAEQTAARTANPAFAARAQVLGQGARTAVKPLPARPGLMGTLGKLIGIGVTKHAYELGFMVGQLSEE